MSSFASFFHVRLISRHLISISPFSLQPTSRGRREALACETSTFSKSLSSQIRGLIIEILFLLQSQTKCRLFPLDIKAPCRELTAELGFFRLMKSKCVSMRERERERARVSGLEGQGRGKRCKFRRITAK